MSKAKKILIDGQQRITALTSAILGQYVINQNYQRVKIKFAFNPIEEKFEVQKPDITKEKTWLQKISDAANRMAELKEISINILK